MEGCFEICKMLSADSNNLSRMIDKWPVIHLSVADGRLGIASWDLVTKRAQAMERRSNAEALDNFSWNLKSGISTRLKCLRSS